MNPKNLSNQDLIDLTKEIEKVWEIDPVQRIIKRRKTNFWIKFLELTGLKRKKFPLQILYRYVKEFFFKSENMPFKFPFNNPGEVRGIYKLTNDYQIPLSDRKFITNGPLYAQDGTTILIPEKRLFFLDRRPVRLIITIIVLTSAFLGIYSKFS